MDTKKIIIGLVGGAVAGYVYNEFIAKKKGVKTVTQGVEEIVEEGEGELKSIGGGGGGGGFGGGALPTETASTETATEEPVVATTKPLVSPTTKPALTSPLAKPIVESKPLIYTKPALVEKEPIMTKTSRFSGIGGDRWEADLNNLDI
jgi:hypothetical protein